MAAIKISKVVVVWVAFLHFLLNAWIVLLALCGAEICTARIGIGMNPFLVKARAFSKNNS